MPTLRQQKLVRINKLLAQSTNFSRREIDKLIDEQRVVAVSYTHLTLPTIYSV